MSDGLEHRVSALEEDIRGLHEIVEGHEKWSHRSRLHRLENDARAAELAESALWAYRNERDHTWNRVREWGGFALALVAVLLASHPWS